MGGILSSLVNGWGCVWSVGGLLFGMVNGGGGGGMFGVTCAMVAGIVNEVFRVIRCA